MAENGNGSLPKPWGEMTEDERNAYLAERQRQKQEGEAAAAPGKRVLTEEQKARKAERRRRNAEFRKAVADLEAQPRPEPRPIPEGWEPPEITAVPVAPEPQTDRASLLMGLDPKIAAKLSDEDIEEILAEERARAEAEDKQKAMKEAREQIRSVMRAEKGLIDAATLRTREQNERLRQKVRIRFDLPAMAADQQGRKGFRIDGKVYEAHQWHTVTVATYESIRSMHYDCWINDVQFTTLDQTSRFGLAMVGGAPRGAGGALKGTTPAKAIWAQAPHQIEVQDAAE